MLEQQLDLLDKAHRQYGVIVPCGNRLRLQDCFSVIQGRLAFWFNTPDGNSHIEVERHPG